MDTVYEKACPACGRSTLLSAKFCSGCGHQYRTVFNDDNSLGDPQSPGSDSSLRGDSTWMPIALAVVPVVLVVFIWIAMSPKPTALQTTQNATGSGVVLTSAAGTTDPNGLPTYGQRQVDVESTLGKPVNITRNSVAGQSSEDWYYARDGHTLKVHFNTNGVVDNTIIY